MQIKDGFRLRNLGREKIVVAEGAAQVDFNKMIVLNESAAYLWESLEGKEFEVEDIVNLLLERYEVEESVARADSEKIASDWKSAGLVQ